MRTRPIVLVAFFLLPLLGLSQARRARVLIEKQKLPEAYALLHKGLAKDSLAAAGKYVLAGLFFNPAFEYQSLDSAYHYILAALRAYELTGPKEQETLANRGFTPAVFQALKEEIEQAGFARAVVGGREKDFSNFIAQFSTSPLTDSAVVLRNAEAFKTARAVNTWPAYHKFFTTYPQAREAPEARRLYEKLLYEEKTADGKLASYEKFCRDYPANRHRPQAEQQIYNIITGRNSPQAQQTFFTSYAQSLLAGRAKLKYYTLVSTEEKEQLLTPDLFSQEVIDSIRFIEKLKGQLALPVVHEGRFQVIDATGATITGGFDNLGRDDKCGTGIPGIILATAAGTNLVLALDSTVLSRGNISAIARQERGMLKVTSAKGVYFITEAGFRDNPHYFRQAQMAGPYIAFYDRGRWGLESVTGLALLPAEYDTLFRFHQQLVLRQGNRWGIFPETWFYPLLEQESIPLELPYDMISIENPDYVLLANKGEIALMDKTGAFVVPLAAQAIELVAGGYFIDRGDSILDTRINHRWYRDIYQNHHWVIGEKPDTMEVFYQGSLVFKSDDARPLGTSAAIVTWADSTFCYFNDSTRLAIAPGDKILPLSTMDVNSRQRHYYYAAKNPGKDAVYNNRGLEIKTGKFDKLLDLGEQYMLSKVKRSFRLLNDSGKVVLQDIDAAISLGNGYVSYLSDGKFGLFNLLNNTHSKPRYDRPFAVYHDSLFVVVKDNKYGLTNRHDSLIVPLYYHEIRYLNDSIAALNSNFRWLFQDLNSGKLLVDNIRDYWPVADTQEPFYKLFKGIGYGIWSPVRGLVLPPTFDEINVKSQHGQLMFVAEKWVEEADLVVMLYYNHQGKLVRKEVLSTAEYEGLVCREE